MTPKYPKFVLNHGEAVHTTITNDYGGSNKGFQENRREAHDPP